MSEHCPTCGWPCDPERLAALYEAFANAQFASSRLQITALYESAQGAVCKAPQEPRAVSDALLASAGFRDGYEPTSFWQSRWANLRATRRRIRFALKRMLPAWMSSRRER